MKLNYLFLIVCYTCCLLAENTIKEYSSIPQGIIFVLDRDNVDYQSAQATHFKELSALPVDVETMLLEGASCPIVVSKSVLATLVRYYLHSKDKEVQKVFSAIQKKWRLKEFEDFYLVYKSSILSTYQGIKLEHFTDTTWEKVDSYVPELPKSTFVQVLSQMFTSKQEYEKSAASTQPAWMIFIDAHGSNGTIIAGLPIDEFKKLMSFLEKKITIKILVYNSCFAGGSNKIKGFEYEYIQQAFSFPVAVLSITNAKTASSGLFSYKFDYLFEQLARASHDIPDYYTLFKKAGFMASPEKNITGGHDIYAVNMPQIRLPHTEWFSVESLSAIKHTKEYAVITKVQAQTREKPLPIEKGVKTILIYTPVVPFSLIFPHTSLDRLPRIVPMEGSRIHFFEINAPNLDFEGICTLFMPLDSALNFIFYSDSICFLNTHLTECIFSLYRNNLGDYVFNLQGTTDAKTRVSYTASVLADKTHSMGVVPAIEFEKTQQEVISDDVKKCHLGPKPLPEYLKFDQFGKKLQKTLNKKQPS